MKWLNTGIQDDGKYASDFNLLFNEWNEVFIKINQVLKHEFKLSYSFENFGNLLVRISIQVINQLIVTLNSIDKEQIKIKDEQFYKEAIEFEESLLRHSRNISSFVDNQFELLLSSNDLEKSETSSIEFDKSSVLTANSNSLSRLSSTFQLNQLLDNELSSDDLENWNQINTAIFRKLKELILKDKLDVCKDVLIKIGLPIDQVFYFILIKSFDKKIVDNLLNYFKEKNIYTNLTEQVELQNELWSLLNFKNNFAINFSSLAYGEQDKIKNLIITALYKCRLNEWTNASLNDQPNQPSHKTNLLKLIDDQSVFKFFLNCNESDMIINLSIKDNFKSIIHFNKIEITDEMIDYCIHNGQELTKQYLLYNLTKNKIFTNLPELNKPNQILKRLYSNCMNRNAQNFCILCKTGLFANLNTKHNQFQDQLINYAIEIKQFDFVYWYLKQENNIKQLKNSKSTDPFIKNVILSLFDYRSDNHNPVKLLNIIIQYCKYFNPHLEINNLNDLFENGLIKEAISCMFLAPTNFNDSSLSPMQMWYMKPDIVLSSLKQHYQLLYEAFNYSLKDFKQQQSLFNADKSPTSKTFDFTDQSLNTLDDNELPNLYSLLKGTIIFDINKLFYWQSTNPYALNNQSTTRSMPTFSNTQLADKFGLKANLNYIYYLTRGRPIQAYYQEIVNKNQADQINIQKSIYKKVCILAFYNCEDSSIVASCISFLEILQLNSLNLTFHIAISRLIMKYAADFLTLKRTDQQEKMGDLLNKACFEENKLAQTNILELIYMALDRKYEQNEKPVVEELIDYEIAVLFARKYLLDLPAQFLIKCIRNDDWLFLTVYIQIYEYPKVFNLCSY